MLALETTVTRARSGNVEATKWLIHARAHFSREDI
jgi:hypothetical protein